jgi:hypothetical protein
MEAACCRYCNINNGFWGDYFKNERGQLDDIYSAAGKSMLQTTTTQWARIFMDEVTTFTAQYQNA